MNGKPMKETLLALSIATLLTLAGCKVSSPGKMETSVIRKVEKTMTIGGKSDKNPLAATPENIKEGGEHFGHHCQICHGLDGHSTGVPFAAQMSPPVPDLGSKDVQDYTDGQLHWIIKNGIAPSGMPAWHGILEEDEMWKAVLFIRNLPAKGSLGAPEVFKEEEEEHRQMEKGAKPTSGMKMQHSH